MALRSIIDIDTNATSFDAFRANFKAYQDALAKQPADWDQIKKSIDGSAKSFQTLVTASIARQAHARTIAAAETEAARQLDRQTRSWHDMARSTRDVAGNIVNMTRSLLRWASLTGVFTGLLGAGGLFGIERLAMSAGSQRRSGLGLGVTPGEQRAFGVNYGRLVNTEGVLGGVNTALTDPSQRVNLYAAGLTENDLRGKDAAQVSVALIDNLKKLADQTDPKLLGGVYRARGIGNLGISLEDFQRLRNTSAGEIAGYRRDFNRDVPTLDLDAKTQKAWQDLQVQLQRAGGQIETTFVKGLTGLAGPLDNLSKSFQETISALLSSPQMKDWIDSFGQGIKWLGDEIRTPEFQRSVKGFVEDVDKLAKTARSWLHWLAGGGKEQYGPLTPDQRDAGGNTTNPEPTQEEVDKSNRKIWEFLKHGGQTTGPDPFGDNPNLGPTPITRKLNELLDWLKAHHWNVPSSGALSPTGYTGGAQSFQRLVHDAAYRPAIDTMPTGKTSQTFAQIEMADGLPSGLLDSVWSAESGRGRNMGPSSAGALGHFQFMPATAKRYGVTNPFDLDQSSRGAGSYLSDLMRRFRGDIAKAVASYNWGEGNVEKDVARWGQDWRAHLPRETQGYLNKVLPGVGINPDRGRNWAVNIYNNTGGSAIVTAAQLAA